MAVKTYDPAQVAINIGGAPITGYADGTFLTVERANPAFIKVTGADGSVSRAKSNDRSGMMTLTLLQTSESNDILSLLALADEFQNAGVVPVTVKDMEGRTTYFAGSGWVQKMADSEFSNEITNREWVIEMAEIDVFVGGNGNIV